MNKLNYLSRPLCAAVASATLLFVSSASAQNVGIGISNPQSKLTVNGNFTVGADYNTAAPTNGALIEGNVGIGTTTPVAPLHVGVASNFNLQNSSSVTYFNYNNNNTTGFTVTPLTGTQAASAIFSSNIFSGSSFVSTNGTFLAASDARLKNIIGRSDSAKDLETLQKIEVTDYTMKDTVKFGNRRFKKVIAQQVEKVYPTAVKTIGYKGFTFTPDIYEAPNSVKPDGQNAYTISLAKTHGLKEGETVRLITDKNPELNVVAHVVDEKTFTVTTKEPLGDKVFVYGKQCLDLKSIDYDAIAMLNVSATQELAKKVETLEAENAKLKGDADRLTTIEGEEKTKIAALQAENAKLTAFVSRVESLEQAFNRLQTKTASRPVALNQ
jgi:Chaperone of endosialidase